MLMLVLDVDGPMVKLPCGCRIYDVKPFSGGKKLDGVYRIEAFWEHEGTMSAYGLPKRHVAWRIWRHVQREDGTPVTVEGPGGRYICRIETTTLDLELRCRHHPDYGA